MVREVDVPAVDRFLGAVKKHHGPSAAKSAKSVMSLLLAMAVRHGALAANPVRDVAKIPDGRKARPRALTSDEVVDLVKKVGADVRAIELDLPDVVSLMLGTGTRIGEALAVRRQVVYLEAGVVEVNAKVVRLKGRGCVVPERPKTEAGWRIIAAPDVVELLRSWIAMAWPRNEHGLFPNVSGHDAQPVQRAADAA